MSWEVAFDTDFDREFSVLSPVVQDKIFAYAELLEMYGPTLSRPYVDTLNGSRHANMKDYDSAQMMVYGESLSPLT